MANIQIADLHSENVVELTAEEQSLIQGGIWPLIVRGIVVSVTAVDRVDAARNFYKGAKKAWNEGCGC
jgi:hypothetical protein